MPLLRRETEIYPANALETSISEAPWWVAHTRSRQEKALARYLLPLDVPFYLPRWEKRTRRGGRTLVSFLPLFPGYVFFRGGAAERHKAIRSHLLVQILEVPDQELLCRELFELRALQVSGACLTPMAELSPGDAVRVVDGPFKGYSGVVVRSQARLRLIVSISMLRQFVAVEFEREALAPISTPSRASEDGRSAVA